MALELHFDPQMALKEAPVKACQTSLSVFLKGFLSEKKYTLVFIYFKCFVFIHLSVYIL